MISRDHISNIVNNQYDLENITIGTLGSHSALEIMDGAKDENMNTVCICQKGREIPYRRFKRLADEIILLDNFSDVMNTENQNKLHQLNTIMITHRALTAYLGYESIENNFGIPIFGNRPLLRAEERTASRNQYYLLEKAKVRHPRIYKNSSDIDGPALVKVQEAKRKLERAFFIVSSYEDYKRKVTLKIEEDLINEEDLNSAIIEEYVIGTYFNFNFFRSPLTNETEFLGIERRLQSIVTPDLNLMVYDVSLRVPGNPIMATTSPYAKYYYGHTMGVGRRIAMEVKNAIEQKRLAQIVT